MKNTKLASKNILFLQKEKEGDGNKEDWFGIFSEGESAADCAFSYAWVISLEEWKQSDGVELRWTKARFGVST